MKQALGEANDKEHGGLACMLGKLPQKAGDATIVCASTKQSKTKNCAQ
jgi:hypothetical protein